MEKITNFLKTENYYNGELINNPCSMGNDSPGYCCFYKDYIDTVTEIEYSIVIGVNDFDACLNEKLIQSIFECTYGNYEIVVIMDQCLQSTEEDIKRQIEENHGSENGVVKITCIKTINPSFYVACLNMGFRVSTGKYIIEITSNIELEQKNYNKKLTLPFESQNNVVAVSGSGCKRFSNSEDFIGGSNGKIKGYSDNFFYINDCCVRGIILYEREMIRQLGYFNECHFFEDYEEDLMARSSFLNNTVCGYVPIDYIESENHPPLIANESRKSWNETIKNSKNKTYGFLTTYLQILYTKKELTINTL
jgi:hypothetical protein